MLQAIGWPDQRLVVDLKQGFPLIGALPRSGVLPSIPFKKGSESAASLRAQAQAINQATLYRVQRPVELDPAVSEIFEAKCEREIAEGHA
eukprot:7441268-Pyramimonas_sp.AAC.1